MDLRAALASTLSGSYEIERELGGGGMARVFVAEERRLHRKVVIKTIAPELLGELSASRFDREMMLAASLQHPHVVPVLSAGVVEGDVPYYTMPYVEGSTLRSRLEAGPLPDADVVRILTHLATAMAYAHGRGVVHRDLKPENILLSDDIAVVTDFGVAKALSEARPSGATLTAAGTVLGTPAYMAPEQATGDPTSDERVDIYAFGVIGYEMLAGRRPFSDGSTHRMIAAHLTEAPPDLTSIRRDAPPALTRILMRCLEKDPADRPRSASALLASLRELSSGPVPLRQQARGRKWIVGATGLGGIALLAAGAFWLTRTPRQEPSPAAAAVPPAIAVLPFENLSRDSASEFISDGMTDEVLSTLERVRALRVASRATTFSLKGRRDEPRAVAAQLGVDALLTGNLRRDGDVILVSTQLVDGRTGLPLWSQSYQRPVHDLHEIQGDIARAIASALRVTLAPGATRVEQPTSDAVAYELYLRGRHVLRQASLADSAQLATAADLFRRAVLRDPDFALAHAQLARTYVSLADHIESRHLVRQAKAAAMRAVQLDPTLTEAGLALASIRLSFEWDWSGAENEYRRILALDSTSADAHMAYARFLSAAGRTDEAILEATHAHRLARAAALDSSRLIPAQQRQIAFMYALMGQEAEADSLFRLALARDSSIAARWSHGLALLALDRPEEAVRVLETVRKERPEELPYLTHLGVAYGGAGVTDSTRQIIRRLESRMKSEYVPKDQLAALYLTLGDTAAALRFLELTIKERHYWVPWINSSQHFQALHGHPEFRRLMREIGAPQR